MYIHIGDDISLMDPWIVCVLDLDSNTTDQKGISTQFLLRAEKEGRLEWVGHDLPRSIVVTADRVYLSPLRAETLLQRCREAASLEKKARQRSENSH